MIEIGKNAPEDVNVIIEIPANNSAVKYEYDKVSKMLIVDRFMSTAMRYPCNYGFIPNSLSLDGDALDALVITPFPITPGAVINTRPIGILNMIDEAGEDAKIITVPVNNLTMLYNTIKNIDDLPKTTLREIKHFFEHYKDLEENKWVKVTNFGDSAEAKNEIKKSIDLFKKSLL